MIMGPENFEMALVGDGRLCRDAMAITQRLSGLVVNSRVLEKIVIT
jgi:hypothetical protein